MIKKLFTFTPLLVIILVSFSIIQVYMLNKYSTIGTKLNQFETEIKKLEGLNINLSEKIASSSSIASISQKASNIGLSRTLEITSLDTPLPVAYHLKLSN